jgi:hypothetical protein
VSKRYAVLRRGAAVLCVLLAATVLVVPRVMAADAAAAPADSAATPAVSPAPPAPPAQVATPDKVKKSRKAERAEKSQKGQKHEKAKKADKVAKVEKPRKVKKPQATPATTSAAATAATPKPAKAPKAPKPPRPPEKSYAEQRAEDGPWAKRATWLSFRAGYAKSAAETAGDGLVGYGLAYQRMMTRQWAFGAAVQHDLLGHLGNSYEISVPFTVEFTRHYNWKTALRPYLGVGGGYYFHKYYRTGNNYTGAPAAGGFINFGANMPLSDRHLLGLDARMSMVGGRDGVVNPVFGAETSTEMLWSLKLGWSLVY